MSDDAHGHCPQCTTALVRKGTGPPWCPRCEWNLDQLGAIDGRLLPGEKRRLRRSHARAFAQNRAMYDEFARDVPQPPGWTRAKVTLAVVSIALLVFNVALAIVGVLFIVTTQFILGFLGVVLVLIATELRPRLDRGKRRDGELVREQAPELYALVDELADRLGAPRVDRIVIDDDFNASCTRVGLRFRPLLTIGVALWGSLTPGGRVALLGHELGHLVNGDPDQGFLTQPALRTFGQLAYFFHPGALPGARLGLGVAARILMTPFWFIFASLQLRLRKIASGDHVRAEIHADVCAVRLAGTRGATEVETSLVLGDEIRTEMRRAARRDGTPATLLAAAESVRTRPEHSLRVLEQVSIRERASLFATHPPSGLRVRLVRAWPWADPSFVLDARRSAEIDAELDDAYRETLRALSLAR